MSKLLTVDPAAQIVQRFHWSETDDAFCVETEQDITDIIEENKRLALDAPARFTEDFNLVARIPIAVYEELRQQGITEDPARFSAWLNDRDNALFRTRGGRV